MSSYYQLVSFPPPKLIAINSPKNNLHDPYKSASKYLYWSLNNKNNVFLPFFLFEIQKTKVILLFSDVRHERRNVAPASSPTTGVKAFREKKVLQNKKTKVWLNDFWNCICGMTSDHRFPLWGEGVRRGGSSLSHYCILTMLVFLKVRRVYFLAREMVFCVRARKFSCRC